MLLDPFLHGRRFYDVLDLISNPYRESRHGIQDQLKKRKRQIILFYALNPQELSCKTGKMLKGD